MAQGIYFDGRSSRQQAVEAAIEGEALLLRTDDGTEHRWPLRALRRLSHHDRGATTAKFARDWNSEERLRIDDAALIEALRQRVPKLDEKRPARPGAVRRALVWSGAALGALALIVFVVVPALAPRLAATIPPEREIAFGDEVFDLLDSVGLHNGVCEGAEGRAALDKMAARVMREIEPRIPLRIDVVRSSVVNAVALPGGRVLLFEPLLEQAASAEEVAGVLAHEIGHVQHADPTREAIRASASTAVIGLIFGDFAGAGVLALAGDRLINTSYTRDAERNADAFAVEHLRAAEVAVAPLAGFMRRFEARGADASMFGGWFATHPSFAERAGRLASVTVPQARPVLSDAEWQALKGICE